MNTTVGEYARASTALADSVNKLYLAGGFALVSLSIGLALVIVANFAGNYQTATLILGASLLLISFFVGLFIQLRGPVRARNALRVNATAIDSMQELSLELTGVAYTTQSFLLRYSSQISDGVGKALPVLRLIPGFGKHLADWKLDKVDELSRQVVAATRDAEAIIRDCEQALRNLDFEALSKYTIRLSEAKRALEAAIGGEK